MSYFTLRPGTNNLTDNTIDSAWNDFKDKLLEVEKPTVPTKSMRVNGTANPQWMTTKIKRSNPPLINKKYM